MRFGIYVHFPYCLSKCRYCDFFSMTSPAPHEAYAQAIGEELRLRQVQWANRRAGSLYLGGGTPSLWEPTSMEKAMLLIARSVTFDSDSEWTLEANPGTIDAARLAAFRAIGFDRLSLGIQSFDDALLSQLGRRHSGAQARSALAAARAAGFDNLSLDLIYGLPGQTLTAALDDLGQALDTGIEHLSHYELMIDDLETKTPLARDVERGAVSLPGEDAVFEMGQALVERACAAGLTRYEISSFARPGRASRHNQLYWTGGEYLGLGCGAVGFALHDPSRPALGGRRWVNLRDPDRYFGALERGELPEASSEDLDADELFDEWLSLGLRQCAGVDLVEAIQRFELPRSRIDAIHARAEALIARGWEGCLERSDDRLWLTRKGLDLHTELAVRLIG
ncbi:MAG: radical SAM family heme chaperone HemW [Myxococcales bacterium]|jgi:oxygen-independent coproporphyrinogen-3 oxidase|nr:radical SAM family heme chaperone HemW [Myxococcales bacterium]